MDKNEEIIECSEKVRKWENELYKIFIKLGSEEQLFRQSCEAKEIYNKIDNAARRYFRLTAQGVIL